MMERAFSRTRHATAAQGPLIEKDPESPVFHDASFTREAKMGMRLCGHHGRGPFPPSSADDEFAMFDAPASGPFPSVWGFVSKRRPFFFFQIIRAPPYCAEINFFSLSVSPGDPGADLPFRRIAKWENKKEKKQK